MRKEYLKRQEVLLNMNVGWILDREHMPIFRLHVIGILLLRIVQPSNSLDCAAGCILEVKDCFEIHDLRDMEERVGKIRC